jgi:hypothetical protein
MSQSPAKTDDPATAFAARQFDSVEAHQDGVRTEATRVVQQPITAEARARWKAEADALPEDSVRYPGPWRVLLDEAYDVTRFVVQRWHPQTQPPFPAALPGLATVQARLPYGITADLVALAHLANEAQNLCLLHARPGESEGPRERANALLGDLVPALDLLFDDDLDDENDVMLEQLRAAFETPDVSIAQLADALSAFGALAERHRDGLVSIGFDVTRLDAVAALVVALRALPPSGQLPTTDDEALRALRNHRDRLATLLYQRMSKVRKAARYSFRKHPDVLREVTSAYQRQRRARARANADAKKPAPAT